MRVYVNFVGVCIRYCHDMAILRTSFAFALHIVYMRSSRGHVTIGVLPNEESECSCVDRYINSAQNIEKNIPISPFTLQSQGQL